MPPTPDDALDQLRDAVSDLARRFPEPGTIGAAVFPSFVEQKILPEPSTSAITLPLSGLDLVLDDDPPTQASNWSAQ
ncbi:hypothetical protein [Streptomyces sp. NPDC002746]